MSSGFATVVSRLSRLSVDNHFDAYDDIAWESDEMAMNPEDSRFELPSYDPLATTDWYRSQTPEIRARVGLYRWAACMKMGWHFENLLQRGALQHAMWLPNGAPEFRYIQHEIVEESHHTMMFQEFMNRTGMPIRGMPGWLRFLAELIVIPLGRIFPALFFIFVISGEDPVDYVQRRQLRDEVNTHPLVERIMRIHTTEEARHLSFARHFMARDVPGLNRLQKIWLSTTGPIVLGVMSRMMLWPQGDMIRYFGIPRSEVWRAFNDEAGRKFLTDSVAKTRRMWEDLGLMTRSSKAIWKAFGLI